ncbi:MAG: phage tail tube protein [Rickettsiales bacterium]
MFNGSLVFLYIKITDDWEIIGSINNIKLDLSNQLIAINNINNDNSWKENANLSGVRQVNITSSGVFSSSRAENYIQKLAFSGAGAEYKVEFGKRNNLVGNFHIEHYQHIAQMEEEETYNISLVSSGEVFFLGQ